MRFNLLGPFEVLSKSGQGCIPPTPRACHVLVLLLSRPNQTVSAESFFLELWRDNPPRTAVTTLQTYIYHVRKMFSRLGVGAPEETLLVTRPPGYLIHVDGSQVDAIQFEGLVNRGRRELERGGREGAAEAARHLDEALALWRGPALGGISPGDVLAGYVTYLEELRIQAHELRIEAAKRLGHHRELIPELRSLVREYPLNEWFHAQLVESLTVSGRRAEALQAYQSLRQMLCEELGLDPAPHLQRLQREVLDPAPRATVVA